MYYFPSYNIRKEDLSREAKEGGGKALSRKGKKNEWSGVIAERYKGIKISK